jgi:hypothetical protein
MKRHSIYFSIIVALIALQSCNRVDESESNFDNVAYLEAAKDQIAEQRAIGNKDSQFDRVIQASLALPASNDVQVSIKTDKSLVKQYNTTQYVDYEPLPDEFFELLNTNATIPAGQVRSTDVVLRFKNLENLPRGATLVLPVTLTDASGVSILKGSQTFYYLLKKGAPITVAANMRQTALYVPTMATTGAACGLNALTAVTMEAMVRAHAWGEGGEASISTLMGIEGYFLLRFGDSNYEDQLQIATSSVFGSNFPSRDASKRLEKDKWYHIAVTYNLATHDLILYIDGKIQAQTTQGSATTMNLLNGTFHIGKSWSDGRYLSGEVCEVRLWNVVRTQAEINQSRYEVAPDSPGLLAYWKFDEGEGSVIHDYTGNGNDLGPAQKEGGGYHNPVVWVPVEVGGE